MLKTQEKMAKYVEGFRFNLGIIGKGQVTAIGDLKAANDLLFGM